MKVKELFEDTYSNVILYGTSSGHVLNGHIKHNYSKDIITGVFDCSGADLTTLEFCPIETKGNFRCNDNSLETLEFGPKKVGGYFDCYNNNLYSLEYAPETVGGNVVCSSNANTISLEGIGVKFLKQIKGDLYLPKNIKSHILGILKIKDLAKVYENNIDEDLLKAIIIVNRHLDSRRLSKCREELIEAGLKEFAKL